MSKHILATCSGTIITLPDGGEIDMTEVDSIYSAAKSALNRPLQRLRLQNELASESAVLDDYYLSLPVESGW